MRHGVYIGPIEELYLKTALLYERYDHQLLAQFDDIDELPFKYTHTWQLYPKEHFKIGEVDK